MAKSDEGATYHVHSEHQQGGITAAVVNIHGPLPATAIISEGTHEHTSDGHKYTTSLRLDSEYVLPVLSIVAKGRSVQSIDVMPMGLAGSMQDTIQGVFNDGSGAFYQFRNASGQYAIEAVTKEAEPVELQVGQRQLL